MTHNALSLEGRSRARMSRGPARGNESHRRRRRHSNIGRWPRLDPRVARAIQSVRQRRPHLGPPSAPGGIATVKLAEELVGGTGDARANGVATRPARLTD